MFKWRTKHISKSEGEQPREERSYDSSPVDAVIFEHTQRVELTQDLCQRTVKSLFRKMEMLENARDNR